ncbi:CsbD family protein [Aurantiacibacter suaedae]|uniref:CsbD family protein n=1 Tax=Aurantiacibacter suaedae TaxID=2545755 RepID=UPI0010F94107|nr:CsbD family protein [Aurantiacibacter suaedae]
MGELTDKAKGLGNQVAGSVKEQSNDPETRAEGKAQKTKGQAQNLKGEVEGALGDKI